MHLRDAKKLIIKNNAHKTVSIEYGHFEDMFYDANAGGYKPEFTKNSDGTEVTIRIDDTFKAQLPTERTRAPYSHNTLAVFSVSSDKMMYNGVQ